MRVSRAIVSTLKGLSAGYAVGLTAALWLKAAVPDADLIWNLVSPFRIGAWIVGAAHGVPLVVRTAGGVDAPQAPGSIARLSELLGGSSDIVFSFSLFLVPISILAVVGIVTARSVRKAGPASGRELAVCSAVAAVAHGLVLAVAAWLSSFEFVAEGRLAPELGLGAATGHLGIGLGQRPLIAFVVGAAWGGAFAAAGGMSSLRLRATIASDDRVVLLAWMRGLATATAIVAGALALGGMFALVTGRVPSPSLVGLGGLLLAGNAVAAGIVASSGAPMSIALDAGPFTGWERLDFFNVGAAGTAMPATWVALVVPLAAGIVAGRFARRRTAYSDAGVALRLGVLWGLSLAVLAMLLRVRVLSSFSVGGLDLGGGSAAFDPLIALATGVATGTVAAFVGTRAGARAATVAADESWTCASCGIANVNDDRFCISCGAERQGSGAHSGA